MPYLVFVMLQISADAGSRAGVLRIGADAVGCDPPGGRRHRGLPPADVCGGEMVLCRFGGPGFRAIAGFTIPGTANSCSSPTPVSAPTSLRQWGASVRHGAWCQHSANGHRHDIPPLLSSSVAAGVHRLFPVDRPGQLLPPGYQINLSIVIGEEASESSGAFSLYLYFKGFSKGPKELHRRACKRAPFILYSNYQLRKRGCLVMQKGKLGICPPFLRHCRIDSGAFGTDTALRTVDGLCDRGREG